jgi:hypothetical protein
MRIHELYAPTIATATGPKGHVSRTIADRIIDPRGYFVRNRKLIKPKSRFVPAGYMPKQS